MFSGEKVLVDLRCDNSLMKTMVDRFGEDVTTLAYDMTSFRVQTEVSASPTFFGWVFGFNGKVQILAPESVKEQYRQMIAQADEGMQEKEKTKDRKSNTPKHTMSRNGRIFPQSSQHEYAEGVELEVYPSADTTAPNYRCEIWVAVNEKAK